MRHARFLVYFLAYLSVLRAYAQPEVAQPAIKVLAKSKASGVWLRWAPVDYVTWQLGNRYGYTIERFTLSADGEAESRTGDKLTPTPLRPIAMEEMDRLSATVPQVAVVQELVYGEDPAAGVTPGDPASVIRLSREQENRYGIALLMCDLYLPVAKAAGLFFEDKTAVKGKRYIYRIGLARQPKNAVLKPGVIVTSHTDEKPLTIVQDVAATFGNRKATVSWPVLFHKGLYAAYHVERSTDGKTFAPLSDLPYVPMTEKQTLETAFFADSLAANNVPYYYRVIGISPFGETGPPSAAATGAGKDDLSGLLILRSGKVTEGDKVSLEWEFPREREHLVSRFVISRAPGPDGPYTDLATRSLSPDKRTYIDNTPYNNSYYQVKAVNKAGDQLALSFPFLVHREDNTPPATPTGLTGAIDKNGVLTLSWKPNTDKDLLGYRVFITNSLKNELVETTKRILDAPTFTDTINTQVLNRKVYFSVIAVDKNYNTSDYSPHLLLRRPDVIAPVAPVFTKAESTSKGVALAWTNSPSEDVARYELWRRSDADTTNRKVATWLIRDKKSLHTDVAPLGQTYRYALVAFDSAGNRGSVYSNIFHETGVRAAVTDFKAVIDREARTITLQWANAPDADRYVLYRKENDGTFILFQTLEEPTTSYRDKDVRVSNQYAYKIQIVYKSGVKSMLSDALKIDF
jgi:fibronectin type 3 domain-containing protein